jgi:integrase
MPPPNRHALTLARLAELIADSKDLKQQSRAELRSAINTFARVVGRNPADVIADPGVIRTLARRAPWRLSDLSQGSWRNIVSRLGKAMQTAGVKVHRQRRNYRLTTPWEDVLAPLKRRDRDDIRRFAGWCSVHGVDPSAVTDAVLQHYLCYLEDTSLQQDPRKRWHVPRRIWNRAIATPGSPFTRLAEPTPPGRRALRWLDCTSSLRAEIDAYRSRMARADCFDPSHKPLKQVTLKGYTNQLLGYVNALVEDGVKPDSLVTLRSLVEPELVKRGLQARLGERRLDEATRPGMHAMATAILNAARYVKAPEAQVAKLRRIAKVVEHRPRGMCAKNRERLAPLRDPEVRTRLLRLPPDIAARLRDVSHPTAHQALLMQRACVLEFLINVPARIKNVAGLRLGVNVLRPIGGKPGAWRVSIPAEDVKNHVALDAELSEETSEMLARYVDVFRPVLLGASTNALFVSMARGAKGERSLSRELSQFIYLEVGLTINAHLLRHFAAYQYLEANPGDYETVRRFLGHKNIMTTINFYAGLETEQAFERYGALIARGRTRLTTTETHP